MMCSYLKKAAILGLGLLFFSSCNITKFLQEDEVLVDKMRIQVEGDFNGTDAAELRQELSNFYEISENKNWRSYNYYKYKDEKKPGWIKSWLKNKHSIPPSLVDTFLIEETKNNMVEYLRNKKGYYQAEVSYDIQNYCCENWSDITFKANTGPRYIINSIRYISRDSTLSSKLDSVAKSSLLKINDPVEALTFDLEKQRIVNAFQQNGFADFNFINVDVQGDSTELHNAWDIFFIITPPINRQSHTQFKIGEINIFTDYHRDQKILQLDTEQRFSKNYKRESESFIVKPSIIDRKLFLRKHDAYNSDLYYKTINSLFSLGTYKFAKLTPKVNLQDSTLIDYDIFLTPHDNKWSLDFGIESFFSNLSLLNRNLIGIATSVGVEDKNVFGGSEVYKTSLEFGVETDIATADITTLSAAFSNTIEMAVITKPLNILESLNKIGIIKNTAYSTLQEGGKSNLQLNFSFLDNLDIYRLTSVEASYGFESVINSRNRITFNQIGLDYNIYQIRSRFDTILQNNTLLERSFQNTLFTGLLFRDLTYFYQSERGTNRSNFALITQLELSGLEVFAANEIANAFTGNNNEWTIGGVDFERLAKLDFDFRWYQKQKPNSQWAARLRAGVAVPLNTSNPVSFIKQYFVGGPSSLRAWRPMHVGAGSYLHDGDAFFEPAANAIFFQRGDILLDASLEYRFDLFWLFEGALFMDAGNVWTLREDDNRPGAKIETDFLSEIAIGYGYGLRIDFTYFLIRFDFGLKLKYPSITLPNNDPSSVQSTIWTSPRQQLPGNFNIAVNYPF